MVTNTAIVVRDTRIQSMIQWNTNKVKNTTNIKSYAKLRILTNKKKGHVT